MSSLLKRKDAQLFVLLGAVFITNALIAEFIGIKIFSLEKTLGFEPFDIALFNIENLSFQLTAGVLLWPIVFILTDVINEYFGIKGVRRLSYLAVAVISYAFVMFYMGMHLVPADWWPGSSVDKGVPDMDVAYRVVYGQGLWIIVGSLVAFLIGQIVDVYTFHRIKRMTGEKMIWLRATGSTLISQLIDSFVVLFIAFYIGQGWSLKLVLAIMTVNYIYKFLMAILLTPVIYLMHGIIDRFLGKEEAERLKKEAMGQE